MSYAIDETLVERPFLVKGMRKFDWGIIGTLYSNDGGEISFKFGNQDLRGEPFEVGDIITVIGKISSYNGAPQVIGDCRKIEPTPEIAAQLMPVSEVDTVAEYNSMMQCAMSIKNAELRAVTVGLLQEHHDTLLTMPAGMSMHHGTIGGWLEHTSGILRGALALDTVYVGKLNRDLLISGAILHDIGKLYEFKLSPLGLVQEYTFLGEGLGHAAIGVGMIMASIKSWGYDPTSPMLAALLNIVGTHAGNREWGACAECITNETVVISNLDYVDSHLNAFTSALQEKAVGEKEFSKATRYNVYKTV